MSEAFQILFGAAALLLGVAAALHALLGKRDPRAAIGWIAVSLFFPIVGPLLYFVFGVNRIGTRAQKMQHRWSRSFSSPQPLGPGEIEQVERHGFPESFAILARVSQAVTRLPLIEGNRIEPLENGEAAYPPMLEAIESAKHSVYLETYIFESNPTGRRFIDALARAAARGLDVRVLIDGIGSLYSRPRSITLLRKRGVRAALFLPPRLFPPTLHINLRNHRKILVTDGELGFTGGMNVGGRHMVQDPDNPHPTVDLHFRVSGPVARQLEETFLADWCFATGDEVPPPNETAPPRAGDGLCRVIVDGPDDNIGKLSTVLNGAVSAARERLCILTPYFLPSREMISALQAAALRGVEVSIVLPEKNNLPFVHWATRNMLWELLANGVRVFYQPPPFAHTKLFMVDDHYVQIGSANMDPRSLRLNFELAVEIYDTTMGRLASAYARQIIDRSREVTLEEVDKRSLPIRVRDSVAWLFQPYL